MLELIQEESRRQLKDAYSFATESLFCEWAYVIDMDKKVLEIYKGFNKSPAKGRFAKMEVSGEYSLKNGYKPVTLFKKLKFEDCYKENLEKLIEKYSKDNE